MSLGRNCSKCSSLTCAKLVEIFPAWNTPTDGSGHDSSMWVCSICLTGAMVPVIRPSTRSWEFGTVKKRFWRNDNEKTMPRGAARSDQHYLRFMDSQCEWATVESTAYDQYIDHFKKHGTMPIAVGLSDDFDPLGDDVSIDVENTNDSHNHPSTPRRLDKRFALETDLGFPIDQQSVRSANSPDISSLGHTPKHHHRRSTEVATPQSETSIASPLSLSTIGGAPLIIDGSVSLGLSPYTTPRKSTCSRKSYDSSLSSPKYNQKLWTPEEDQVLMRAINAQEKATLKWSAVAKEVPGRSGKQCRERYLNHLTPSIKLKNWSPVEDATIFRLYHTEGSKWSLMSKILRGRTDNGIKNRYHHLKRILDRQMQAGTTSAEVDAIFSQLETNPLLEQYERWILKYVAMQSFQPSEALDENEAAGYLRQGENELCARCGLFAPSKQTGKLVCKTTGWCEVCIRVSPCVTGDLLRTLIHMRKGSLSE